MAVGKDKMVEHGAIERFGDSHQTSCCPAVGIARSRVSTRMVVCEQNSGAVMLNRIDNNRLQWEGSVGLKPLVSRQVQTEAGSIDMGGPKRFERGIRPRELFFEEPARSGQAIKFGALEWHPFQLNR
jgi:hypothetical protein